MTTLLIVYAIYSIIIAFCGMMGSTVGRNGQEPGLAVDKFFAYLLFWPILMFITTYQSEVNNLIK